MSEPEMPGWEWLGSHTPQGWPYLTRSDNIGLTPQYTQRLARTLAETVGQAPPAPDEVFDTGRVTDFTGVSGWTASQESHWRIVNNWAEMFVKLTATGSQSIGRVQERVAESAGFKSDRTAQLTWRHQSGYMGGGAISGAGNMYLTADVETSFSSGQYLEVTLIPFLVE